MTKTLKTLCLCVLMALSACGDTQDLYVKGRCRLYFDNTTHNDATLATAMTPYSGAFVTITAQNNQFVFTSNQGLSSKVNMTAVDTQRGYILGMNNGNYSAIIGRYRICQFIKPQIRLESHDKKFCCASWLFQRPNEVRGKRPPRSLNETCRSSSV